MHSHNHNQGSDRQKNIGIAIFLNIAFTIIEIIGGLLTNSLTILADALHDFGDSVALIASWLLERKSQMPADAKRTFGYQRLSLLSAFFSAAVLIVGSLYILSEAIPRLMNPQPVHAVGMLGLAILGIVFNGLGFLRLKKGTSMNEKTLSWHLLEDVLGWVVILLGSLTMLVWNNPIIDPILTVGFISFTLWGVGKTVKESFNIFLQGVPEHIDLEHIKSAITSTEGVIGVHDIHIWSLEGETDILSAHIVVTTNNLRDADNLRKRLKEILHDLHIEHSTLEIESEESCAGTEHESH